MEFKGNGIVWDKEKDKRLAAFDKAGNFETKDPRTIKILKKLGYSFSGVETFTDGKVKTEKIKEVTEDGPSWNDLKKQAKELGIKVKVGMSREDLLKLLEAESVIVDDSIPDEESNPDEEL